MKLFTIALVTALTFAGYCQANASTYVIDMYEDGGNVVATGGGSIDLTGLSFLGQFGNGTSYIDSSNSLIFLGSDSLRDRYYSIEGSSFVGSGVRTYADSVSGDLIGLFGNQYSGDLYLPGGYISDSPLSGTATWDNTTLSSLGVPLGTYTWTWNSGANSLTLNVFATVPEPSQYGLGMVIALAGLVTIRRLKIA